VCWDGIWGGYGIYFHYGTILEVMMATLTIKNIPDKLYQELKQKAAINHRSINSEVIVSLEQVLHKSHISAKKMLERARELRVKANAEIHLTDKVLKDAKERGRL
jgi:plasmid stability protein